MSRKKICGSTGDGGEYDVEVVIITGSAAVYLTLS